MYKFFGVSGKSTAAVLGLSLMGVVSSQAQLLPIVVPTADLGTPTGVGISDGGFESGIGDFTAIGETEVTGTIGGSGLLSPTQGSSQLFLETTGTIDSFLANPFTSTVALDIVIDVFLGLRPNSIDGFVGFTDLDGESEGATEGSAVRRTFEVLTPTTLTFDYAFLTDELDQPSDFSDTAFFSLDGELFLLGNVETAADFTTLSGVTGFDGVIPYQTFSIPLDVGIHTIGFGVVDVSDTIVNSALLIDNIVVSPEPTTAMLLVLTTGCVMLRRRA
ncbi:MAG: PEP-CTERM sorting domain-containing protein [Planctomycetota bacterium]